MISATVIKDSINKSGTRITTFELEYPRFIHSEVMTHRMFSRNSASSRAIPIAKVIEQVKNNPAVPVHFGKNQSGMQAKEELQGIPKVAAIDSWLCAAEEMASRAKVLSDIGLHKQVVNRLLEPFQIMKVIVTATEYNNFFWLRDHPDAQPEIQKLARVMKGAYDYSKPEFLEKDMWHLPYVVTKQEDGVQTYWLDADTEISLEDAIKISCSCAAQVSYRKLDTSLEKAKDIYRKLVESEPVHASAFEHVAKPMQVDKWPEYISPDVWLDYEEKGVTHADRDGYYWSGNFKGWIQYRQLIPNNVKLG
jgi:thymidylate synthase ThyX